MEEQIDDSRLRTRIAERIRDEGPLTFAAFMAACLYEPGLGYYTSPGKKVGAEGDYYTSSNVHAMFGRMIARELCSMWETMGRPADFTICEAGAGNGQLAADILTTLAELKHDFYATLTYRLMDMEPSLLEIQRKNLASHLDRLAWSSPADMEAGKLSFSGCILSNELLDAMPVHIVEPTGKGLREVYVTAHGNEFNEILSHPSTPELENYLARIGINLCDWQRAEINLSALKWLESVAKALDRGFVLTIDYGYPASELYSPTRGRGTLLCYYRHTVEENPYIRVGLQDMTSHVDFTSVIQRGEELGLNKIWFGEQYRFLMSAGLMDELLMMEACAASEEEQLKNRLAVKKLILPDGGMGDTFKVLIQAKGVEDPKLLCLQPWTRHLGEHGSAGQEHPR